VTFDVSDEAVASGGDDPGRVGASVSPPSVSPESVPPESVPLSEQNRRLRRLQDASAAGPARRFGRTGRDLPAAIGVGLVLAAAVLGSLLYRKEIFVGLVSAAMVLAVWELVGAFAARKIQAPVIPLVVGSIGMLVSAYVARAEGLLVAFTTTAFGVLLWRLVDGLSGAVRDISAGVFIAAYVPFLAGFAIIMLAEPDGAMRVLVYIAAVVASDVGGFAAGVLFGRHPLAPSVSPKKSWEGFAGSVLTSMVVAGVGVTVLLDGPWWAGPALGAASAVTGTLGDLSESLIKRDLGVKDMSSVLPGHGGMMDRIDSLLLTAPAAFVLLALLVEPAA
jgi:phosphatidate cytidylyltransferase